MKLTDYSFWTSCVPECLLNKPMSTRKVSSGRKRALWVVGGTEVTPIGGVVTSGDYKRDFTFSTSFLHVTSTYIRSFDAVRWGLICPVSLFLIISFVLCVPYAKFVVNVLLYKYETRLIETFLRCKNIVFNMSLRKRASFLTSKQESTSILV